MNCIGNVSDQAGGSIYRITNLKKRGYSVFHVDLINSQVMKPAQSLSIGG